MTASNKSCSISIPIFPRRGSLQFEGSVFGCWTDPSCSRPGWPCGAWWRGREICGEGEGNVGQCAVLVSRCVPLFVASSPTWSAHHHPTETIPPTPPGAATPGASLSRRPPPPTRTTLGPVLLLHQLQRRLFALAPVVADFCRAPRPPGRLRSPLALALSLVGERLARPRRRPAVAAVTRRRGAVEGTHGTRVSAVVSAVSANGLQKKWF